MSRNYLTLVLLLFYSIMGPQVFGQSETGPVFRGMTAAEVIETLGPPSSELARSGAAFMLYGGNTIELRDGRVFKTKGIKMEYTTPDGSGQFTYRSGQGWRLNGDSVDKNYRATSIPVEGEEAEAQAPAVVRDPPSPKTVAPPVAEPVVQPALEPAAGNEDTSVDDAIAEFEQMLDDIDSGEYDEYGEYSEFDEDWEDEPLPWWGLLIVFAIGFLVEFVVTTLVLKIAFGVKGFPVMWRQILLVGLLMAIASIGVDVAVDYFEFHLGFVLYFIKLGILMGLIIGLTDVQKPGTAFAIAIIARIVSLVLVWIMVFVIVLLVGALMVSAGSGF
ncbi:MAG: hypothetical protein AAFX93_16065 [Verrucomicrobiota bacterium]